MEYIHLGSVSCIAFKEGGLSVLARFLINKIQTMDALKIQCVYKYCEFYSSFKVHIIRFKSSELFGNMESNANCKIESFLHFSSWSEYHKRPYLFKQTVLTWGVFPCDLVHLTLNWRARDLCSTISSALHSTVTPCHCPFFFLCLGVVILEFSWNWVKRERWRNMGSLDFYLF